MASGFSFAFVWFADSPASSAKAAVKGPVPAAWIASSRGARISMRSRAAVSERTPGCTTPPGVAARATPNAALPSLPASASRSRASSRRTGAGVPSPGVCVVSASRSCICL